LQFIINFCKDISSAEDASEWKNALSFRTLVLVVRRIYLLYRCLDPSEDEPALAMASSSQDLAVEGNLDDPPLPATSPSPSSGQEPPIFFTLVEFSTDVPIRLDYHGKHGMDMGQVRS
jgi:hypothetical protein